MAIFGTNNNYAMEYPQYAMNGSDAEFDSIMTESYKDAYKLEAGMYVADVMMEEQVLTEGASAEVLLEAFGGNFFSKVKEMFKKLWAKLKSWYDAFIKNVKLIFLSGKKFIKEFKNELNRKTNKGYTYKSYDYKNTMSQIKAIDEKMGTVVEGIITEYSIQKNLVGPISEKVKSENLSDTKEAICESIISGCVTPEELVSEMNEMVFGDGNKTEFEDFENLSKAEMIDIVETTDKDLAKLESEVKKAETRFNRIIKDTESAEKTFKDGDGEKGMAIVHNNVEMLRFGVTIMSTVTKQWAVIGKRIAQDCEAVLKGYLRFKPVKESFTGEGEGTATQGILEAAMRFV